METHYFYVKHMASNECMLTVSNVFKQLNLPIISIEPGRVGLVQPIKKAMRITLNKALQKENFSLIINSEAGLINHVKCCVNQLVHHREEKKIDVPFSSYLAEKTGKSYQELNRLFTYTEYCSVGDYVAKQRVKKAKQLLTKYRDEYNIRDLSVNIGYNGPEYLCMQFKKITGTTIGKYRNRGVKERRMFSLR